MHDLVTFHFQLSC